MNNSAIGLAHLHCYPQLEKCDVIVTKAYALPDVDVIILDFFFKSATLELIEVLPAKEKSVLIRDVYLP